jgi:hypothetical protein
MSAKYLNLDSELSVVDPTASLPELLDNDGTLLLLLVNCILDEISSHKCQYSFISHISKLDKYKCFANVLSALSTCVNTYYVNPFAIILQIVLKLKTVSNIPVDLVGKAVSGGVGVSSLDSRIYQTVENVGNLQDMTFSSQCDAILVYDNFSRHYTECSSENVRDASNRPIPIWTNTAVIACHNEGRERLQSNPKYSPRNWPSLKYANPNLVMFGDACFPESTVLPMNHSSISLLSPSLSPPLLALFHPSQHALSNHIVFIHQNILFPTNFNFPISPLNLASNLARPHCHLPS